MIKRLIRMVRRQPKPVRDNIALVIAGTFTSIIFVIWLYHMPVRNAVMTNAIAENGSTASFSQFFDDMLNQVAAIKESVSPTKEIINLDEDELDRNLQEKKVIKLPTEAAGLDWTTVDRTATSPIVRDSTSDTKAVVNQVTASSSQTSESVSASDQPLPTSRAIRIVTVNSSTTIASSTAN